MSQFLWSSAFTWRSRSGFYTHLAILVYTFFKWLLSVSHTLLSIGFPFFFSPSSYFWPPTSRFIVLFCSFSTTAYYAKNFLLYNKSRRDTYPRLMTLEGNSRCSPRSSPTMLTGQHHGRWNLIYQSSSEWYRRGALHHSGACRSTTIRSTIRVSIWPSTFWRHSIRLMWRTPLHIISSMV